MANCFYCEGKNPPKECIANRMYVMSENGDCYNYDVARKDLAKLNARQTKGITLRTMLAQYLSDNGQTEEALEILTLPEPLCEM